MLQTETIAQVRQFNRFYTRQLGLLAARPYGDFTLTETRVLFELAQHKGLNPSFLVQALGLDPAYLSRILKRFSVLGLIDRVRDPDDGRGLIVSLTPRGREVFAPLDAAASQAVKAMMAPLPAEAQDELAQAFATAARLLTRAPADTRLRSLQIGDIGEITRRQGEVYANEYGWDITYEALVAEILAKFVADFDPARDESFIADHDGKVVGSAFLVHGDQPDIARLRLLYVDAATRGLGLGRQLVDACVAAARAKGYKKLILWTQDCLISARRIYRAAGFQLVSEERHHRFGQDLNAQVWELPLH
ncbi:MAG TPA: bifunctional helix-turn-helix transcriptional regulator/GNAT family N-acetyltransferase [Asticcacaulis sp.]|nr:bifunctional helix-turn-helix transcriptional regulator/GNAT family N-acetyltransferase [Asticcacaulis sp.]